MSNPNIRFQFFLDRENRKLDWKSEDVVISFPLNPLPDPLYQAIAGAYAGRSGYRDVLDFLFHSTMMRPTVCSSTADSVFSFNTAIKVVRLTLTDREIENRIDEIEGQILSFQGRTFEDSLEERMEAYTDLLIDDSKIDRFRLGAAEMYGDVTYANIQRDPRVTLNFFWYQPDPVMGMSYQLNCIAEIIPPKDPFYRYMRAMRQLFAFRFVDLRSTEYICAYKFWVCDVKEKTLSARPGFVPSVYDVW